MTEQLDAAVALEARLGRIEAKIDFNHQVVVDRLEKLEAQVYKQNSRVGTLEESEDARERREAFGAGFRKGQLAILGLLFVAAQLGINLVLRLLG